MSGKLKKTVAVSKEKIQERFRRQGQSFSGHSDRDSISCCRKSAKNIPAASDLPEIPSDSHSLLEYFEHAVVDAEKQGWPRFGSPSTCRPPWPPQLSAVRSLQYIEET